MTDTSHGILSRRSLALAASMLLNLFLIALIAGHLWQSRGDDVGYDRNLGTPLSRALARAEAALPPQDAAAFGAAIRRDGPRYAKAARELGEARQVFWRQVTAERFSQHDVREALDGWRTAWNRFLDDFSGTVVAALAEVSPQGRRRLASIGRPGAGAAAPASEDTRE